VLSTIVATPIATSTTITWVTDEMADSVVKFATTSPVVGAVGMRLVENVSDVLGHSLTLTDLSASTTYYFVVVSTDPSGNTATSTEGTFLTHEIIVADQTAPVISAVSATTSSTTATVIWTTDELATSLLKYATSSPVLSAGEVFTEENVSLTLSHNLNLTGLVASTTYYYLPISVDGSGNTATGTEAMITTLGE